MTEEQASALDEKGLEAVIAQLNDEAPGKRYEAAEHLASHPEAQEALKARLAIETNRTVRALLKALVSEVTMTDDPRALSSAAAEVKGRLTDKRLAEMIVAYEWLTEQPLRDDAPPEHVTRRASDLDRLSAFRELRDSRDLLLSQAAALAALSDPVVVRVNILRGTIAIPEDLVWLHDTNGPVAELRARADALAVERDGWKKEAFEVADESNNWRGKFEAAEASLAAKVSEETELRTALGELTSRAYFENDRGIGWRIGERDGESNHDLIQRARELVLRLNVVG